MRNRIPRFITPKESLLERWAGIFSILLSTTPRAVARPPSLLRHVLTESKVRPRAQTLIASLLFHVSIAIFLTHMPPGLFPSPRRALHSEALRNAVIYYDLGAVHFEKTLPNLSSPAAGSKLGRSSGPNESSAARAESFHPRLTIVMNPPVPDNNRQTVVQPASPPDLKLDQEPDLPNILMGSTAAPPKPALPLHLSTPRAPATNHSELAALAPANDLTTASNTPFTPLPLLTSSPKLAVPISPMPAPNAKRSGRSPGSVSGNSQPTADAPGALLAIGVEPGALDSLIALPPGNRYGSFAISPAGGQPSAPADMAGGDPQGNGTELAGGGEASSVPGSGKMGGGGGETAVGSPAMTVSGGDAKFSGAAVAEAENHALLDAVSAGQIFPVLTAPKTRSLNLQVFTGPAGGGGLGVYHELPCNKIYTAMLPMPDKNWTLQYCTPEADKPALPTAGNRVLQLDQGLASPDPTEKFDFKRPPGSSAGTSGRLIVLRGSISEEGTVENLTVLSGTGRDVNALAAAAFRRWKFRPATRSGKPVGVEILVGIPVRTP